MAYASRSCNSTERNYNSYDGESLVVVWAVQHFRHYLIGSEFLLLTDHAALKWMMTTSKLTERLARWSLLLQVLGPSLQSLGLFSEVSTLSARALLAQFPL